MFHKFHLMIKFLSEYRKGSKKPFIPPAQKLHSLVSYIPNSHKEETLGISSLEAETGQNLAEAGPNLAEAGPNLLKAELEKKDEEAITVNGPCSARKKKVKVQDNKQAEKKKKVSVILMGSSGTISSSHPSWTNRMFPCWGNLSCSFSFLFLFWDFYFFHKKIKNVLMTVFSKK